MLTRNPCLSGVPARPSSPWSRHTITARELWWWRGAWGAMAPLAASLSWWRQTCPNSPGEQCVPHALPCQQCYVTRTKVRSLYQARPPQRLRWGRHSGQTGERGQFAPVLPGTSWTWHHLYQDSLLDADSVQQMRLPGRRHTCKCAGPSGVITMATMVSETHTMNPCLKAWSLLSRHHDCGDFFWPGVCCQHLSTLFFILYSHFY